MDDKPLFNNGLIINIENISGVDERTLLCFYFDINSKLERVFSIVASALEHDPVWLLIDNGVHIEKVLIGNLYELRIVSERINEYKKINNK